MDADVVARAVRAGELVDEAAGALVDLEPLLSPPAQQHHELPEIPAVDRGLDGEPGGSGS